MGDASKYWYSSVRNYCILLDKQSSTFPNNWHMFTCVRKKFLNLVPWQWCIDKRWLATLDLHVKSAVKNWWTESFCLLPPVVFLGLKINFVHLRYRNTCFTGLFKVHFHIIVIENYFTSLELFSTFFIQRLIIILFIIIQSAQWLLTCIFTLIHS